MHSALNWLGPASSIATVIALIVTLLYYLYWPPFNLKKPQGLTATCDNDRVQLRWGLVQRASHYDVYRINAQSRVMDIFSCTTHHFTDTSLGDGATYEYHLVAEDQGHQSPQSDVVSITIKPPVCPPPPIIGNGDELVDPIKPDFPEAQWPMEDLRQLFGELQKKNNKTVLTILEMTASKPDTRVSLAEVCERADVTRPQGGGGLSAFTRLINSMGKTRWPFTFHEGQGGPYYKLSQEMAGRWRQVEANGVAQ